MKHSHVNGESRLRKTAKSLLSLLLCGGMALTGLGGVQRPHTLLTAV